MPPTIIQPPERGKQEVTTASGLILPPSMYKSKLAAVPGEKGSNIAYLQSRYNQLQQTGFHGGTPITREPETMIVCFPEKYSGIDDFMMGEIIDGNVRNIGPSPVVSSLLSAAVMKQVAQVSNGDITLTGKNTPTKKARDGIAWWNDSPTGAVYGLSRMAYQLLVYNRGAPVATVPIIYAFDDWEEFGLIAHPMPNKDQKAEDALYWWLEVDWQKHGSPIPYLPSVFDLEATGNQEWPYWYRVKVEKKDRWVLLHHSQIIPVLPGYSQKDGYGTSAAWLITEPLSMFIISQDAKMEELVNAPTTGIVGISGTEEAPSDIKKRMEDDRKRAIAGGSYFDKSPFIIVSPDKEIKFNTFSFRNFEAWKQEDIERFEDRVATVLRMSLNELGISRKGVGYAGQAQSTANLTADSGAGYLLSLIASALGSIYPRVQVSVSRPNDLARQQQLTNFKTLADAVKGLPDRTLDRDEVRAMIESLVGIKIPDAGDGVTTSPGSDDTTDIEEDTGNDQADGTQAEENQVLHRAIESMLMEAWLLHSFAPVEEVMAGDKAKRLYSFIYKALDKQYRSANVKKIVDGIQKAGIELDDPNFLGKVVPIVRRNTKQLKSLTDLAALISLLDAIRVEGRREAEAQGKAADKTLSPAERRSVDTRGKAELDKRVSQLFVKATGDNDTDTLPLDDQRAIQTLDVHGYEEITALIWAAMWDFTEIIQIERAYLASIDVSGRATLITEVEGIRGYNIGFSKTGEKLGALKKRWERTVSRNPREKHLAIVGEVVGIDKRFSTGDNWAGELYNCRCGITLLWE